MTVPAGVDEAGGAVDQQAEAAERALALQARDEIVGERDPLERRAEHELAGMQDERTTVLDLDQLREVFLRLLRVDVGRRVVAEDSEQAVDVEVDGRRLDRAVVERVDDDPARRELLTDGDVRQDHGAGAYRRAPDRE